MGTRFFVGFVADQKLYTQYGQYDGYPSGVGKDVLNFASRISDVETTKARVRTLKVVQQDGHPTPAEAKEVSTWTDAHVSTGDDWYSALRHTQGRLDLVLESGYIVDSDGFWNDSLMCEWAYLVDLDEQTLEVYEGFQEHPHEKGRFASPTPGYTTSSGTGYYPVALRTVYSLADLPTPDEFVKLEEMDA